jgi:3-oxoadipate enol-lactonase
MKYTVDGVALAYEYDGSGAPLVLLHGFPFSRLMWRPQVNALAAVCRLILPDLRGFGESAGVPDSLDRLADDIDALVNHLGLTSFALGGFSMGGYVLFRYLARHPGRAKALLLLDTRPEADSPEARQRRFAGIERIGKEGPSGFLEDFVKLILSSATFASRPEVVEEVKRLMDRRVASLTAGLRAMANRPDSTPLLAEITVPTLIVVGADDQATPLASSRKMAEAIRGSTLVTIPGAGHMANLEQPEAFTAALVGFVRMLR